jgi:hypothetical protein
MRGRLLALAAIAFVSRLPQLLSSNLLVDGDEAVLGLMAKHFAVGREFPLFFWGQRYGLSTLEAGAAAVAFRLAGTGPIPLKIAMLALWTCGALLLFLALTRVVESRAAFWIAAVFVLTPAWAVWSMKARGGYITAFVASAALAWVVIGRRDRETARWFVAGTLTAVIWLAQPIWLPSVLTLVVAVLVSRRRVLSSAAYVATAVALTFAVKAIPVTSSETWAGPALGNPSLWGTRVRVAQQIYVNLTGSYYLMSAVPPGAITTIVAAAWCVVLIVLPIAQIFRVVTRRYNAASHVLFAAVVATLAGNWILLFARDGRYLLPLAVPLVALAGIDAHDLLPKRTVAVVIAIVLAAGAVSMLEFRNFAFLWTNPPGSLSEMRRLQLVVNSLTSRGVRHAVSMNGLLDTQLIFYSDEQIVARWSNPNDRHPAYVSEVDAAIAAGQPVAVVGYTNESGAPGCWDVPICTGGLERIVPNPESIFIVDGKYFVYLGATRPLLERLGIQFPP